MASRVRRLAWRAVLLVLAATVLAELGLQAAAVLAPDPDGAWRAAATRRILCVGDSHTWGTEVARDATYPAHLQRLLDARAPGEYSVINLGLPGMNSSQLRGRLPSWLGRYAPDVLVVWIGVNNRWNVADADVDIDSWKVWLEGLALRSRLWRLFRVVQHGRSLERYAVDRADDRTYAITEQPPVGAPDESSFETRHDGVIERFQHRRSELPDAAIRSRGIRQALNDYAAILALTRAAGVRLVLLTYPYGDLAALSPINYAIVGFGYEHDVPVVETWTSVARIPEGEREWLWAGHPSGPMYEEIARDLLPLVARSATE